MFRDGALPASHESRARDSESAAELLQRRIDFMQNDEHIRNVHGAFIIRRREVQMERRVQAMLGGTES